MYNYEDFIMSFPLPKNSEKPQYELHPKKKSKKELIKEFSKFWELAGGKFIFLKQKAMIPLTLSELPIFKENSNVYIQSHLKFIIHNLPKQMKLKIYTDSDFYYPDEPQILQIAIVESQMGLSENGSIGIEMNTISYRSILFLTEHLILLLNKKNLHSQFESALSRWKNFIKNGGYLISGPSKTADIEQSLVIGAHGPKSCTAIIY